MKIIIDLHFRELNKLFINHNHFFGKNFRKIKKTLQRNFKSILTKFQKKKFKESSTECKQILKKNHLK